MPFPFKFVFDENPLSEQEIVEHFLKKNKTVYTRMVAPEEKLGDLTALGDTYQGTFTSEKMSLNEAWPEIREGKRRLYFDNTWKQEDYQSVMSDVAYNTLMESSIFSFGTMFMSSAKKYYLTAPAHSAPIKSVATQSLNKKDWVFIDPKVQKKYLKSELSSTVTGVVQITQDHDEILKHVPHYSVSTNAGEGIYFPEYWTHIVYTEPGLNIMTNWRQYTQFMEAFNSPHPMKIQMKLAILSSLFKYVVPEKIGDWVKAYSQDLLQKEKSKNAWMRGAIAAVN